MSSDERSPQTQALAAQLERLGIKLVDAPPAGSPLARVLALEDAWERGLITEDEFKAALGRLLDRVTAEYRSGRASLEPRH